MNIKGALRTASLVGALVASNSLAQGTLDIDYDRDAVVVPDPYPYWNGSGWEIGIIADWAFEHGPSTTVTIRATDGECPIDYIHVICDRYQTIENNLQLIVEEDGGTIPRITTIKELDGFSPGEVWVFRVEISGYVGNSASPHDSANAIDADIVAKVTADGGVFADLFSGPREFSGASTIQRVKTTNGLIRGHIYAPYGDIFEIISPIGIGTPSDPVTIEAGDRIHFINTTNGDLHANIDAVNVQYPGDNPNAEGILITGDVTNTQITLSNSFRDDFIITGGDFADSSEVHALHLADMAELKIKKDDNGVGGSVLGDMYFSGVLGDQSLIEIHRSLAGNLVFNGDGTSSLNDDMYILGDLGNAEGLTGQVILNADATPINEAWGDGLVKFGPDGAGQIILDPIPYYDNPSSTIGGGAVGLVPYYLRYQDCDPVGVKFQEDMGTGLDGLDPCEEGYHGIVLVHPADPMPTVTLRHYGPVEQHGTGLPFTVKRRSLGVIDCQ